MTANHLMWNDSIARHVGWPSQIIDSLPIISMAADDISGCRAGRPLERVAWRRVSSVETPGRRTASSARSKRAGWRRYAFAGAGVAIVVVTFAFVLPKIADYRDVWDVVTTLTWQWVAVLVGATVLNLATFAPPWMVALPGLRFRQALVDDAGLDGALDRRARRRGGRHGGLLGDAAGLGLPAGATSRARSR